MKSLNKVMLIGNLTKDPELIEFGTGNKLAKFTLATNRNWVNKDGEKNNVTDFHQIVAWRKLAEICVNHLKKGAAVLIEGKIFNNKFEDKEGKMKYSTEVHADEINFITYKNNKDMDEVNLVTVDEE